MLALLLLLAAARAESLPAAPDPSAVTAADDARARELFQNGAMLYAEGRYEDAIVAWREAWRLSGRPLLLFNMANAAERVARWDEAVDLLSRYRAFAPADERETLERRIRNLERRIAESSGAPAPSVDPNAAGSTPAAALPAATATGPVPATGATTPPPTPSAAPAVTAATAAPRTPPRLRALPIALFSAGGASVVTGSVFAVRALDARAQADALCTTFSGETRCPDAAAQALATDRGSALVADVAFGVGIAALGGGVIAALLPGERAVSVGLSVGDGAYVSVGGVLP